MRHTYKTLLNKTFKQVEASLAKVDELVSSDVVKNDEKALFEFQSILKPKLQAALHVLTISANDKRTIRMNFLKAEAIRISKEMKDLEDEGIAVND